MIHIVICKSLLFDLLRCQIPGQLVYDRTNNFKMRKFFCTYM
jgi:hypothetical protein